MSAEPGSCHSTPGCSLQDDRDTEVEVTESSRNLNMDLQQPILSALNVLRNEIRSAKEDSGLSGKAAVTSSDSESGIFSGESELCVEHESDLDWFCCSEQKLICSHCTIVGSCQGHTVTALANRVTAVRNHLVDVCEKMQLQALRIEHFINKTLTAKERALQVEASGARERVVAQVSVVREAVEEEEQRLLEAVQREEERVEQCLLTQRAHWGQALAMLTQTRTRLVHTLTNTPDIQLATSGQEIADRVEDAEGVGEPCDTDRLNLNAGCSDSKLMRGLWASAILLGPIAYGSAHLTFDERTVSSLLSLSEDLCTLTFLPKRSRQSPPYDPARFDSWPNALGTLSISSGTHSWVMDVGESGAFKVGVCYTSMGRKGSGNNSRLGYNGQSWVLSKYDGDFSFCHAGKNTPLHVIHKPKSLGLLLDWPSQTLVFYDPDSSAVLHSVRHAFSGPLLPAFAVADRSVTILHCPPK
ncbi:B box and SPRY domain-containing protein-like isoform X1 [Oncorhynchus clarkii lewisi]|uniref:B box and SPRY domain-containing protein-like isoform X1 n=1 Tax=Oncorhynchus clarkii lewisi TaxID=490388 RepID=UPI0039B8AD6A